MQEVGEAKMRQFWRTKDRMLLIQRRAGPVWLAIFAVSKHRMGQGYGIERDERCVPTHERALAGSPDALRRFLDESVGLGAKRVRCSCRSRRRCCSTRGASGDFSI
jgi:hypothetical protein